MMFVKLQIAARDPKTKVSFFLLLFRFRWFLAQIAIKTVPPIVNQQKKLSEYEFSRKIAFVVVFSRKSSFSRGACEMRYISFIDLFALKKVIPTICNVIFVKIPVKS